MATQQTPMTAAGNPSEGALTRVTRMMQDRRLPTWQLQAVFKEVALTLGRDVSLDTDEHSPDELVAICTPPIRKLSQHEAILSRCDHILTLISAMLAQEASEMGCPNLTAVFGAPPRMAHGPPIYNYHPRPGSMTINELLRIEPGVMPNFDYNLRPDRDFERWLSGPRGGDEGPPVSFTPFRHLPPELQDYIWELALEAPTPCVHVACALSASGTWPSGPIPTVFRDHGAFNNPDNETRRDPSHPAALATPAGLLFSRNNRGILAATRASRLAAWRVYCLLACGKPRNMRPCPGLGVWDRSKSALSTPLVAVLGHLRAGYTRSSPEWDELMVQLAGIASVEFDSTPLEELPQMVRVCLLISQFNRFMARRADEVTKFQKVMPGLLNDWRRALDRVIYRPGIQLAMIDRVLRLESCLDTAVRAFYKRNSDNTPRELRNDMKVRYLLGVRAVYSSSGAKTTDVADVADVVGVAGVADVADVDMSETEASTRVKTEDSTLDGKVAENTQSGHLPNMCCSVMDKSQ